MPDGMADVKLAFEPVVAEWRNWQTHQTQNLAKFTLRVGSTPTSATNEIKDKSPPFPGGLILLRKSIFRTKPIYADWLLQVRI
jgi:hypothetical protein